MKIILARPRGFCAGLSARSMSQKIFLAWPLLGWGFALGLRYGTVFRRMPISDAIRREMEKGR
jgi:hypothetical protein